MVGESNLEYGGLLITGGVGSGKSTLLCQLSKKLGRTLRLCKRN